MDNLLGKKILVTGGAGFIGSNLVEHLLENGVKYVRILDNLATGDKNNIANLLQSYPNNVEFMYGDISSMEICRKAVKTMDIVCHQAAIGSVPRSIVDPLTTHLSNNNGFANILIATKEEGIKRVVYASSSSVYGDSPDLPKKEDITGHVLSPYAATKAIDEIYAQVFSRCYQMECIGLRYFNVFGPKQNPNGPYAAVIPKFIDLIKCHVQPIINGDGSFSRDFTYIDNVIQANILAMTTTNQKAYGNVFNIGAGGQISILELFNTIKDELNSTINPIFGPNRDGDIPHSNADITKAQKVLGYDPLVTFQEGIKKTIKSLQGPQLHLSMDQIDFNALLNRDPIVVDNSIAKIYLQNKLIWVTGGCGSIGSEIVRQLLHLGLRNILIYDNSECGMFNLKSEIMNLYTNHNVKFILGDVTDFAKLDYIMANNRPAIIFHAAAYKHVPIMEENAYESVKVNIKGTKNVADLALYYNTEKFVMISTDKAVNPTNIMGASKRICEVYVNYLNQFNKTNYITTRFGNVLGSSGSVIPTLIKRINEKQNLQITDKEIIRYFMTIPEAAQLVIHSVILCHSSEILMFNMGKPVKIYDLAQNLLSKYAPHNGLEIEIIGLRPSEKLYEELLCDGENVIPTENKDIMRMKHKQDIDYNEFLKKFTELIECDTFNSQEIKDKFKKIIPEYSI